MTHKRTTKKALFTSAVSLLLCLAMLIGTTLAWFTDSVSSGSNIITSGNLDIDVQYSLDGENWKDLAGATDLFSKGLWEPGHTEVVALKVINKGSLALKYNAAMSIFSETPGVNQAGEEFKLSEYLKVSSMTMDGGAIGDVLASYAFENEDSIWSGVTPVGFGSMALGQEGIILEKGQTSYTILKVDMPETVGNEANHNGTDVPNIEFGINVVATQYAHEFDSFGNQYDKHATFEQLADPSISAVESKMLESGADFIEFAVSTNGFNLAKVTVPASAIADTTAPVTVSFDGMNPADTITMGTNTKAYAFDIKVSNLKEELADDQLVTVVVTAPYALPMMKAYHNGEEIAATYDELAGTITFKTANFSPFAFSYTEKTVSTLDELRTAVVENNVLIKLGANLTVDLGTDTGAVYTAQNSGGDGYYYTKAYKNGVIVSGQNVAVDLNGHKITVTCATDKLGDAGALFFVDPAIVGSSLNIIDQSQAQTGTIEMKASVYMVWANEDPTGDDDGVDKTVTYDVDIYSGKFVADAYAGDPVAPGGENYAENSNCAIVYAGNGGTINVYGGYFLYDNTYNSKVQNSNNGAFNVMTHVTTPCITLHDGVMLSNEYYKQANGTDDDSITLAKFCEVVENVSHSVTIDGKTYNTWYRVTERKPVSLTVTGYKDVFSNGDSFEQGEEFAATVLLSDGTTCDVTDKVTFSGYDSSTVGANVITVTYTSEGESVSTTYIVRFIVPVNLTVEPKKTLYNVGEVNAKDFKVTVYDSTGVATTLSDFDISVDGNINVAGHVNVTISKDGLSDTCTILMWNMNKLEGNDMHTMHYNVPVLFNVSGWSNHTLGAGYLGLLGQTHTIPSTEEVVTDISFANNIRYNGSSPTGYVYTRGTDGNLTVKNASRYTTLGVEYWLGYDAQISAVGYYFDGDMSTLQFTGAAHDISPTNEYYQFLGENAFRTNYLTCDLYDFKPGSTHTVHWVAIFPDGIQTFAEWTVTMKAENKDDASYEHDPNKTNVNVIVLAGQSNAAGSAPITDEIRAQYGDKKFSNVFINYINQEAVGNTVTTYFTNGNNFDMYKLGIGGFGSNYFGPELGLADYLSTNAPNETWYIIKYAPSGSELDRQWFGDINLADRMIGYVKDKINILAQDYNVKFAGFVWMQGESDALDLVPGIAGRYSSNEQKLVKMVRDEFAAYATRNSTALGTPGSGIVFVNGGIAASGVWPEHATVNAAKKANCAWWFDPVAGGFTNPGGNIANSLFVDTSTLISKNQSYAESLDDYGNTQDNSDQAHYSDESMVKLGTWFGQGLQSMIINCP